jgi:hypothetical protein
MAIKKVEGIFRDLPVTSLLRAFPVMEDEDRTQLLNVFRSYSVTKLSVENPYLFEYYQIEDIDFLDSIAFKFYGNSSLWWVVADFNEITNPFETLTPGETLKILRNDYLYILYDDIQVIGDL